MKKTDLVIYKDRIKKLHKAALLFQAAHEDLETQQNKMLGGKFDVDSDWDKLSKFMDNNPDLSDKLKEVENIIDEIAD